MRDILFRGKRIDNGEWVEGGIIPLDIESGYLFIAEPYLSTSTLPVYEIVKNYTHLVIPETVGQHTGLRDKDGKRIFEGDFVRLDKYVKKAFDVCDGVVRYGRGGFYISEFEPLHSLNTIANAEGVLRGEVIGNIHDNPKLLVK